MLPCRDGWCGPRLPGAAQARAPSDGGEPAVTKELITTDQPAYEPPKERMFGRMITLAEKNDRGCQLNSRMLALRFFASLRERPLVRAKTQRSAKNAKGRSL